MLHDSHHAGLTHKRNSSRFLTEHRHVAWVALVFTMLWGLYGYLGMPKSKDPLVPERVAAVVTPWPGASAEKVELLMARRLEEKIAENSKVRKIDSLCRGGVSVIQIELDEAARDPGKEFDDIKLKLDAIKDLPQGAGPMEFMKDFGDTAALMLTVASPPADEVDVAIRAREVRQAIESARAGAGPGPRLSGVVCLPRSQSPGYLERQVNLVARHLADTGAARDIRPLTGPAFLGLDLATSLTQDQLLALVDAFLRERLRVLELHPDVWDVALIGDPAQTEERLRQTAGDKYTYRQLDDFSDLIKRRLQGVPQVAKVSRSGVLGERVYLEYSQERLAAYGVQFSQIDQALNARNITLPGGMLEVAGRGLAVDPSGEFKSEADIGDVPMAASPSGAPVYLRDVVEIVRGYEGPPSFLNFFSQPDANGQWRRHRAVTLAVSMRPGEQISALGREVNRCLEGLKDRLPHDLVIARTSDQPLQVKESVDLFMNSLYEAILLVVLVALVGFWEWRSALLMALSIPVTLAMTFGMMHLLGIDLQQVSIASLIIALGLLVDDPVVAGDAIKRELDQGQPRLTAAWLGPTKLATAILYATITNIVAYLPLLILSGDLGRFIYSLPVVLTCSLVASRVVSMTFVPLLAYYLLRPSQKKAAQAGPRRGFPALYARVVGWSLKHRWAVVGMALLSLGGGWFIMQGVKSQFFPNDLSYLSYVEVWLPEDATLAATHEAAQQAEAIIADEARAWGREHPGPGGQPRRTLTSLTTFLGGGGPRFWFSINSEQQQPNYAQIVVQLDDKHHTEAFLARIQRRLLAEVPGAQIDARRLETGTPVGLPVAVRISGEDMGQLRLLAAQAKEIFWRQPLAERVRDDWGEEAFKVKLAIDGEKANLAGVTNLDVALSSAASLSGLPMDNLRDGDKLIPIVVRLRQEERAQLSDLGDLLVHAQAGPQKVRLNQIATIHQQAETEKIKRRNQFRTITVSCFPVEGALPSEVLGQALPAIQQLQASLPPGYRLELGGEKEEQDKGFGEMAVVMLVSVAGIFLALVAQFKNAVKPLVVFAAIPFGLVGAWAGLAVMDQPFGFMAFLGVASLIGVIVSHIIVLFDFIEEKREEGEPLEQALTEAGIVRLRPVMVTVGATVLGLFPLAINGGPLWEPLCYTQIGGLTLATLVTLILVPVLYTIFVRDLKIISWDSAPQPGAPGRQP